MFGHLGEVGPAHREDAAGRLVTLLDDPIGAGRHRHRFVRPAKRVAVEFLGLVDVVRHQFVPIEVSVRRPVHHVLLTAPAYARV